MANPSVVGVYDVFELDGIGSSFHVILEHFSDCSRNNGRSRDHCFDD